jgi:hypothetical protein
LRPQSIQPGPGQEAVWGCPNISSIEDFPRRDLVWKQGIMAFVTRPSKRDPVPCHAPAYVIPRQDMTMHGLNISCTTPSASGGVG